MKKISNKPKDWIKAFLVTSIGLTIFNIFAHIDIFLELILVNIISALCGYILFEAINVLIYNKKISDKYKMKSLIILLAFILISCETQEQPQQNCICENAKFFIPSTESRSEIIPPLGLNYIYIPNCELDCTTGQPLTKPTENARYIGCE